MYFLPLTDKKMANLWHFLKCSNSLKLLCWGSSCGPLIRKIIAASSLNRAIQSLSYSTRQSYCQNILAFPELSVNPRAVDKAKTVQYHFKRSFREVREVLLWQDVVNNSISPHRSKMFKHLAHLKLIGILKGLSCRVKFFLLHSVGSWGHIWNV